MGGIDVLHPQYFLNDHDNLISVSPMKNRRNPKFNLAQTPNSTASNGRRRSPPTGILRKEKNAEPVAKNLILGQVKILKRGEVLTESSVLKDVKDRKASNGAASTPSNDVGGDPKAPRTVAGDRKKKAEKEKKRISKPNPNPNFEASKAADDFALSSTDRLGPDPDMVPELFFAGSAFYDSPPPSSVPLPGFYTKNFSAAVKADPTTDLRRILGLSLS